MCSVSLLISYSLLLGFMVMSAFLSMWLSNTATTAMMLPIAISVIKELGQCTDLPRDAADDQRQESESQIHVETPAANPDEAMSYRDYGASELPTRVPQSGGRNDRMTVPLSIGREAERHWSNDIVDRSNHTALEIASQQSARTGSASAVSVNAGVDLPAELKDEGQPLSDTVIRLSKGLVIGIAFAANIGGIATLVGTPTNLVLTGTVTK